MFCKNCGSEISTEAKFCAKCGAIVPPVSTPPPVSPPPKDFYFPAPPVKKRRFPSTIVYIIVIILIFVGATWFLNQGEQNQTQQNVTNNVTNTSSWQDFYSTSGKFKATFPTYPTHESQNTPIPGTALSYTMDMYTSIMADETTYIIGCATYPSSIDVSKTDNMLEAVLNGIVASNKDNKLISSNFTSFNGYRAIDYLIQQNTVLMKGKNFLVGQTLYELLYGYYSQNYNESNYNKFINSFTLQ